MVNDNQTRALEELRTAFNLAAKFGDPLGTVLRLSRALEIIVSDLSYKAGIHHRDPALY